MKHFKDYAKEHKLSKIDCLRLKINLLKLKELIPSYIGLKYGESFGMCNVVTIHIYNPEKLKEYLDYISYQNYINAYWFDIGEIIPRIKWCEQTIRKINTYLKYRSW